MAETTDVLVLGGGAIGTTIALGLRDQGLAVTLVDRGALVSEASWAAAGILAPQSESATPGPLCDLLLGSRKVWPDLAAELLERTGIDVRYRREGTLKLALDEAERAELEVRLGWQRAAGLAGEWLDASAVAEREPALVRCLGAA